MMRQVRYVFAALALLIAGLAPLPASASMAPAGLATAADQVSPLAVTEVRWGRGGGRGFRGGGFRGHRGFYRPRAHFRPYRAHRSFYRPRPVYYGYGRSCIRRGWVWNGWRHVWRRYRVC